MYLTRLITIYIRYSIVLIMIMSTTSTVNNKIAPWQTLFEIIYGCAEKRKGAVVYRSAFNENKAICIRANPFFINNNMIHLVWHLENPAMSAIWNCTNRENNVANYLKKPFDMGNLLTINSIQLWSNDYTYIVRSIVLKSLFIGLVYK